MMRHLARILLTVLTLYLLTTTVSAAAYVDDMDDSASNSIKQYQQLSFRSLDTSAGTGWGNLPDRTAATFASTSSPVGRATYRVQNAQSVSVAIYTNFGSFAGTTPNQSGGYSFGIAQSNSAPSVSSVTQAQYSPGSDAVYARISNKLYRLYYDRNVYALSPSEESPGDLIGYGVNVSSSSDGSSFQRLSLSYSQLQYQSGNALVYEVLTANVPSGAQWIQVEINDTSRIPYLNQAGSYLEKTANSMTHLASVTISGDHLVMGIPEPVVQEGTGLSLESESSSQKSGQTALSPNHSAETAGSSGSVSGSSSAVSKFEGVITSSSGSGRNSSKSQSEADVDESTQSESELEPQPVREDVAIQHLSRQETDDNGYFTVGVTVYIILMAGAILFVMLRPGK